MTKTICDIKKENINRLGKAYAKAKRNGTLTPKLSSENNKKSSSK